MDKVDELLTRGVDKIYPTKKALEKVLRSGRKIKLYLGVDPSGEKLHIGHMAPLFKLEKFRQLGHRVTLLIGDFTGQIGDPTDKSATRTKLTHKQVLDNAITYKKQAEKVLNFDKKPKVSVRYNSQWLSKLTFEDIIELSSYFTVSQLIERDMFKKRLKMGKAIYLHEFLYPLMQGYDSVAMDIDLEIGGTDQTFNMLAGRTLLKTLKNKEKFVITLPLLSDKTGKKIGKTEGNVIAVTSKPKDFYGMIMNLPDDVIIPCFEQITDIPATKIIKIKKALKRGENPMTYKKKLAFELTKMLNSKKDAEDAQGYFENTFQRKSLPRKAKVIKLDNKNQAILDILAEHDLVKSRSEGKRLIRNKAIELDGKKVTSINKKIKKGSSLILRIGKHRFYKLSFNR